jgi:ATP-dependent Lon protease
LIPNAQKAAGIADGVVDFSQEGIETLIRNYCRESGVRNLQKHIEKVGEICLLAMFATALVSWSNIICFVQIFRKAAVKVVQDKASSIPVDAATLVDFVGNPVFVNERLYDTTPAGVVMGLAWTSLGTTTRVEGSM